MSIRMVQMEALYKCTRTGCYHPRCDKMMHIMDREECDLNGNPLYTAYCDFHGYVVGGVREAELIYPKEENEKKISEPPTAEEIADKVVERIAKQDGKNSEKKAINKVGKEVKLLRNELGYGNSSPHKRKSKNEKCIKLAVEYYWDYIDKGTAKHNAVSMACKKVEKEIGRGTYKTSQSFWSALNDEVKKLGGNRQVTEYPDPGEIRN